MLGAVVSHENAPCQHLENWKYEKCRTGRDSWKVLILKSPKKEKKFYRGTLYPEKEETNTLRRGLRFGDSLRLRFSAFEILAILLCLHHPGKLVLINERAELLRDFQIVQTVTSVSALRRVIRLSVSSYCNN